MLVTIYYLFVTVYGSSAPPSSLREEWRIRVLITRPPCLSSLTLVIWQAMTGMLLLLIFASLGGSVELRSGKWEQFLLSVPPSPFYFNSDYYLLTPFGKSIVLKRPKRPIATPPSFLGSIGTCYLCSVENCFKSVFGDFLPSDIGSKVVTSLGDSFVFCSWPSSDWFSWETPTTPTCVSVLLIFFSITLGSRRSSTEIFDTFLIFPY